MESDEIAYPAENRPCVKGWGDKYRPQTGLRVIRGHGPRQWRAL